jgi:hypothetical protein
MLGLAMGQGGPTTDADDANLIPVVSWLRAAEMPPRGTKDVVNATGHATGLVVSSGDDRQVGSPRGVTRPGLLYGFFLSLPFASPLCSHER